MDLLARLLEDKGSVPNRLTVGMGKLIRQAREDAGFSQAKLAQLIHRRRPSVTDMENGKMVPDAEDLLYLSVNLKKPITFFYPDRFGEWLRSDKTSTLEHELLLQAKRLPRGDLKRLVAQAQALADLAQRSTE